MVINIGELKAGNCEYVRSEIDSVVKAAQGRLVKVIIETCYLTKAEIVTASDLVGQTGAAFVKTSTGFGPAGATPEDVRLMKANARGKEVKAAGGVRTRDDLDKMVEAGATRIGTSNGVAIVQNGQGSGY
jgi:deoxyribose-phosphate aldolase